jgi:hypothetical protein
MLECAIQVNVSHIGHLVPNTLKWLKYALALRSACSRSRQGQKPRGSYIPSGLIALAHDSTFSSEQRIENATDERNAVRALLAGESWPHEKGTEPRLKALESVAGGVLRS